MYMNDEWVRNKKNQHRIIHVTPHITIELSLFPSSKSDDIPVKRPSRPLVGEHWHRLPGQFLQNNCLKGLKVTFSKKELQKADRTDMLNSMTLRFGPICWKSYWPKGSWSKAYICGTFLSWSWMIPWSYAWATNREVPKNLWYHSFRWSIWIFNYMNCVRSSSIHCASPNCAFRNFHDSDVHRFMADSDEGHGIRVKKWQLLGGKVSLKLDTQQRWKDITVAIIITLIFWSFFQNCLHLIDWYLLEQGKGW